MEAETLCWKGRISGQREVSLSKVPEDGMSLVVTPEGRN